MNNSSIIQAELTWFEGEFIPGVRVTLGDDGRISKVQRGVDDAPTHPGQALLPGFVNAHSHAFQRALRGLGEHVPSREEDFWTWREAMYTLVESLDLDRMRRICVQAFKEMRLAGITTVGEFHYLHHPGDEAHSGDRIILEAAREAGIRIVLIQVHYVAGGIGTPLSSGQERFNTSGLDEFWSTLDQAQASCTRNQSMAVAAHSIRAVPIEQVVELHAEACRRGLVVHMHLEEQVQEIEACREATGSTPVRLVLDRLSPGSEFTAIHATHTIPSDLEDLLGAGCHICLCPLTEANLGDGIPDREAMQMHQGSICIGTDSNARISMIEELRLLELSHRLQSRGRGAWRDASGHVHKTLLDMATVNGARSLGLDAGLIEEGALADLVLVDLEAASLADIEPHALGAAIVLGSGNEAVIDTCVGGLWGLGQ